jgi:hypothetical protein
MHPSCINTPALFEPATWRGRDCGSRCLCCINTPALFEPATLPLHFTDFVEIFKEQTPTWFGAEG